MSSSIRLLLSPNRLSTANRIRGWSRRRWSIAAGFGLFSLAFFGGMGAGIFEFLTYLHGVPLIGGIIIDKLLLIAMMSFFAFLLFSNIVTSISSYYLSDDLSLLMSLPAPIQQLHRMKFIETLVESSWMIVVFSLPLFIPIGLVFEADIKYYFLITLMWPPLLVIPSMLGVALSTILINLFPARRIREILLASGFLTLFGLLMALLYLEPARWIDPDRARSVAEYVASLKIPESSFLPSTWAARMVSGLLRGDTRYGYYLLLLWSNALVYFIAGDAFVTALMRRGLTKAAEARTARFANNRYFEKVIEATTRPLSPAFRAILKKDIKTLLRDASQWSQLVILSAIIIIYVYAMAIYPLDLFESWMIYIQNMVSFLNIGLVGFMVSAISLRFVFPSISLEGRSYWFVRSSPLTIRQLVFSKYIIFGLPLFLLGMLLVVSANWLLGVPDIMMYMTTGASVFVLLGSLSIIMGYGAANPEFKFENIAKLALGFSGITCVILASSYVFVSMLLLSFPILSVLRAEYTEHALRGLPAIYAAAAVAVFLLLSLAMIVKPLQWGIRALERREF